MVDLIHFQTLPRTVIYYSQQIKWEIIKVVGDIVNSNGKRDIPVN